MFLAKIQLKPFLKHTFYILHYFIYYTRSWRCYSTLEVTAVTWGEPRQKTNLPANTAPAQKRLQEGWAQHRGTQYTKAQRKECSHLTGDTRQRRRSSLGVRVIWLPGTSPECATELKSHGTAGSAAAGIARIKAGLDTPAVGYDRLPAAVRTSPQQENNNKGCELVREGEKLGLDLLNDVGLGATGRDLELVICCEKGALLGQTAKRRHGKSAASWRRRVTQESLETRLWLVRLMILV